MNRLLLDLGSLWLDVMAHGALKATTAKYNASSMMDAVSEAVYQ
jgi:hypothetical protein